MSGRKKKDMEEPEVMIEPEVVPEEPIAVEAEPQEVVEEDGAPNYVLPEVKDPPRTPYEIATAIRNDIRETMAKAPKRNDATTMPAIVNLRCQTGDFHFMMPQFDAVTVEKLWNRHKHEATPEQFVSYLYTTMGFNPPKLYMYMNIVNIA